MPGSTAGSAPVGAPPEPVQMLSWRDLARSAWSLLALSARIVLRRKLLFMALGVVGYYAILYAVAVYDPGVAVHGVLLATLMLMSTASYFLFAEFP